MSVLAPRLLTLTCLVLLALPVPSVQADIIYDNSSTGGTNLYYSTFEFGDEVMIDQGTTHSTNRVMGEFMFEYSGSFVATGNETARLRLYKNDGPVFIDTDGFQVPTPGTLLFDTGAFPIAPVAPPEYIATKSFAGLNVVLPNDFTWTVQFSGFAPQQQSGLVIRPKPSVGDSYSDFWQKTGDKWQLLMQNGFDMNFAARILSGGGPRISIRRETGKVIIEWTGLSVLQIADEANGPYIDQTGPRNRYELNPQIAARKFWRLKN